MRAGYPRSLPEFEARFTSESACRDYLESLRWKEGCRCPHCTGAARSRKTNRGLWTCKRCRHQWSVAAGTILQDSHLPLLTWLRAMWLVSGKKGANARELQRMLNLGSYKTAWALLLKLRRAMAGANDIYLRERIERGTFTLGTRKKLAVNVAVETEHDLGRIHMAPYRGDEEFFFFPPKEARASVTTVGEQNRFDKNERSVAGEVMHQFRRWLSVTHSGAIEETHLEYYLAEFSFRFNHRKSTSPGKPFNELARQAVHTKPAPVANLPKRESPKTKTHRPS